MEIVALHVRITDLLFHSLQFLEEYDCETVGMSPTQTSPVQLMKLIHDKAILRQPSVTWETSFSLYNMSWQNLRLVENQIPSCTMSFYFYFYFYWLV